MFDPIDKRNGREAGRSVDSLSNDIAGENNKSNEHTAVMET